MAGGGEAWSVWSGRGTRLRRAEDASGEEDAAARVVELRTSEVRELSGLIRPGSRRSFLLRLRTVVVLIGNRRSRPQEPVEVVARQGSLTRSEVVSSSVL